MLSPPNLNPLPSEFDPVYDEFFAFRSAQQSVNMTGLVDIITALGYYWFTIVELAPDTTRENEPV